MSLLVELSPKLVLEFNEGKNTCEISCDLRTKNLYKLMKSYQCDFKLLSTLGGNFGEEIYDYFTKNSVKVERVDVRDDSVPSNVYRQARKTECRHDESYCAYHCLHAKSRVCKYLNFRCILCSKAHR